MYGICTKYDLLEHVMNDRDRTFFLNIKRAITSNPFSSKRTDADRELAGIGGAGSESSDMLAPALERVAKKLETFERTRGRKSGEDLDLYHYGKLFEMFHRYLVPFDTLIANQIKQGDVSCTVTFAGEILQELHAAGFAEHQSVRYLALFYQMRRAFYFINSIAGQSRPVLDLKKALWNNIFTGDLELYDDYLWNRMEDFSTMLLGETGTGKGLAASAIGRSGYVPFDEKKNVFKESFAKSFVSINLSQFPVQLIESELFGHRKGAFTGAVEAHRGIFSRCSAHGAIFIDEIGDVSIPVQIKLLQVLQERIFTPVGSHHREKFRGRVIAATNRPLSQLRREGKFREDFYYRLCSDVIEVPPLRSRLQDNPDELRTILSFTVERIIGRPSARLVEKIAFKLDKEVPEQYQWPGNIRELEQCVRQILLNGSYSWNMGDSTCEHPLLADMENGSVTAAQLLAGYCGRLYEKHGSYEAVAKITDLDRRTVRKHVVNDQTRQE